MSTDLPPTTPEGELIRLARHRTSPRLSIRAAAKKAGISPETWGYVERGYQPQSHGKPPRPHISPPDTLAHMAATVGVSPERLEEIDRHDAAAVLREIQRRDEERAADQDTTEAGSLTAVPDWVTAEERRALRRLHDDAIGRGLDKTGDLEDGLDVRWPKRERDIWDIMRDGYSPAERADIIIYLRDLEDGRDPEKKKPESTRAQDRDAGTSHRR